MVTFPQDTARMRAMTLSQPTPAQDSRQDPFRWHRRHAASAYADFADPCQPPGSQRHYAQQHGIPRSTLGYWLRKEDPDFLDPQWVRFFRSPAGYAFQRRLVLAVLLTFHHENACGLRSIASFLEQIHFNHLMGCSYGALHHLDSWLQENLHRFGQEERHRLASGMADKDIVLCPDENFHGPHICLVAIEPVSNYIAVEAYRDQRDSVTWAQAIREGTEGLPVHVVLLTSDQASGLVCCAETELEVAHQPDLFHLQQDLAQPILLPLARSIQQAQKELDKLKQQEQKLERTEQNKPGSLTIDKCLAHLRQEVQAQKDLDEARQRHERAVGHIRAVSEVYHPFDRQTGQPITAESMRQRLDESLEQLQKVVEEAGLSEKAHQAVSRARKWVVLLVGCLGWFWAMTRQRLESWECSEEAQRKIEECLVAGYYWEMASVKEKDPEKRQRLAALGRRLQEEAWSKGSVLSDWGPEEKAALQKEARQGAELFQRSSSCVEGRNGRLSLYHHGQTRLSEKRLAALTAIHNYVVRRRDGTTAAERFFGQKQRDAFTWLLEKMPDLPQPAAKRRKQPSNEIPAAT
jgi:hypothetical protein